MKRSDENSFTIKFSKIEISAKGRYAITVAAVVMLILIPLIVLITKGIIG